MNCKNCKASCVHKGEDYGGKCLVGYVPMTNADRIRQMTDEELALYFADFETKCYLRLEPTADCDTVNFAKQHLEWLKEEVKENAN